MGFFLKEGGGEGGLKRSESHLQANYWNFMDQILQFFLPK